MQVSENNAKNMDYTFRRKKELSSPSLKLTL